MDKRFILTKKYETEEAVRYILLTFDYNPSTGEITRKSDGSIATMEKTDQGYKIMFFLKRLWKAHRVAFVLGYGKFPDECIDHIDGCRSNNSLENLRDVPARINNANKGSHIKGKLVGSSLDKKTGKWTSFFVASDITINLGTYNSEAEANSEYLRALKEFQSTGLVTQTKKRSGRRPSKSCGARKIRENNWQAVICIDGKRISLGCSRTREGAEKKYLDALSRVPKTITIVHDFRNKYNIPLKRVDTRLDL